MTEKELAQVIKLLMEALKITPGGTANLGKLALKNPLLLARLIIFAEENK